MTHTQAYALLALVTVIWAGNFPLAKAGLAELSPVTLTATRALLTAPALLAVVRAVYGPLPALRRRDYVTFVTLALAGLVGNTTIWYWGMRYTSPVNAGILGAAAPVLVALASAAWLHDPLSRRNVIGVGLTAVAVLLTVAHGSLDVLRTLSFNRGDIIILCSQLLWTTYTLYSRANKSSLPSATVQAGVYVVSALVLVPLALFERPWATLAPGGLGGVGRRSLRGRLRHREPHLVLPVRARRGGGAGRRVHEPHPVRRDRAVRAHARRGDPLVSPGRRDCRPRRGGPGHHEVTGPCG